MSTSIEVLDRIEETLRQSLAAVADPAAAPPRDDSACREVLGRFDVRMRRWQQSLDDAQSAAAEADAALAAEQAALQDCRERLETAIEALARWCGQHPGPSPRG